MLADCVFCRIVAGEAPATVLFDWEDYDAIGIRPLNPVTEGHVLVIPKHHEADALENPWRTGQAMEAAARWAEGPCNIITSVGPEATQSVFHLHIHIVPRHEGDGLALPWTGDWAQRLVASSPANVCQRCLRIRSHCSCDAPSVAAEVRDIDDALRYCLHGVTIRGCASPGLMDDTLARLEILAKRLAGEEQCRNCQQPLATHCACHRGCRGQCPRDREDRVYRTFENGVEVR